MLTVGTLVEGTLSAGTLAAGTPTPDGLTLGTLTPAMPMPAMPMPDTPSEWTATVDGAPGADTAPATALTDAPSAAPQAPAASAFTVICRRLRLCAGMFSHRALPSDPPPANAACSEPYSLLVASTVSVRLVKKDAFALRVAVAPYIAERGETTRPRDFSTCWKGFLQPDHSNWTQG
jgi:hypothetical protein